MKRRWKAAAPLVVWAVLGALPTPAGLEPEAWRYFGLFAAVITGLILEPLPAAAIGLLGVTTAVVLGFVGSSPKEAASWGLQGFANRTVWLIFGAFMLSLGYERSGLGRRIALLLVRRLGRRTLGLGYALVLADLLLAPGTPSNTARSGGMIYPVVRGIPGLFDSEPGPTARRIGAYLMWTAFAATGVTSSLFLTSLAPNLLAVSLVQQELQLDITWGQWCLGFLPVGIFLLVLLPWLTYVCYPPEIRTSEGVPHWAAQELKVLGSISRKEIVMASLAAMALGLWIFGSRFVDATMVVFLVISLMIIAGVVDWNDILENKKAWNVLVWFATLLTLASGLNEVGFIDWAANRFARLLSGFPSLMAMVVLVSFFFLIHYMFASLTAHTVALLQVMLAVGANLPGVPTLPCALLLCYSLGLMGVLTPYATGPAPVYYASGFVARPDFWRLGLIFGLIYLAALLLIGVPYLLFLDRVLW